MSQLRVTKLAHSCLRVDNGEQVVLIDPGTFSWQSGLVKDEHLKDINTILVTHEHADHLCWEFVEAALKCSPEATVIGTESITTQFEERGLTATTQENELVQVFTTKHEDLPWGADPPQNVGFHLFDRLTDPGDSYSFNETKEILALPIVAPWGSATEAMRLVTKLKPQAVIPLHDWFFHDEARDWTYARNSEFLQQFKIDFVPLKGGETITL